MNKEIKLLIEEWKFYRGMTLDILEILSESDLNFTIGKNMGNLGKQFRHIGDVELCYIEGIKTKKIDFTKYRRDYKLDKSKEKLRNFLNEMDNDLFISIKNLSAKKKKLRIDWGFDNLSLESHLKNLIYHEILHHGELIVYIRTLGLKFPKSWEAWGL